MNTIIVFNRAHLVDIDVAIATFKGVTLTLTCDSLTELLALNIHLLGPRYFVIGAGKQITPEEFGTFVETKLAPYAQGAEIMDDIAMFGPPLITARFREAALKKNRKRAQ